MTDIEGHQERLPAVMNYEQAGRYLGISAGRLRNLRWLGMGPPSISYGKRDVRFRVVDLDSWLARKAGQPSVMVPARKRLNPRPRKGGIEFTTSGITAQSDETAETIRVGWVWLIIFLAMIAVVALIKFL